MKKYLILSFATLLACQQGSEKNNGLNTESKAPEAHQLFSFLSPESTGVSFVNKIQDNEFVNILTYEYFYNGGGVAAGDINNDGLIDLYFTANQGKNKLYLNQGDLKFKDITKSAGVESPQGWKTGVTMADVNGDELLDIYVCKSGKYDPENRKNVLYINNGDLTFTEKAADYGLDDQAYSTQALFFDYDNDNDLDLYLLNHSIRLFLGELAMDLKKQQDPYAGDKIFENQNGSFIDISSKAKLSQNPLGYGLGIAAGDINNDGWTDLYVCNDYVEPDYIYLNNKDGTFKNITKSATRHTSNFSMGVDINDMNNDGLQDIMVLDMVAEDNYRQKTNMRPMNPEEFYMAVENGFHYQYMFNSLQLNNGNNTFSEIAQLAGISNTDWSWAPLFADLDNDGWKDIFVTNGFRKEFSNKDFVNYRKQLTKKAIKKGKEVRLEAMRKLLDQLPVNKISNYVFKNNKDLTFSKMVGKWGFDQPSHSNGATFADLDNDGDLEVIINNIDHPAFIYENNSESGNYLQVQFNGPKYNTSGIGAKITIQTDEATQHYQHFLTRGYQSSMSDRIHVGLGEYNEVDELIVQWPDGSIQKLENVEGNKILKLNHKDASKAETPYYTEDLLFADATQQLKVKHKHIENNFDDFQREVLLPHKMSQFGPALAVADVNGDGKDDFYVGGAMNFPGALYLQGNSGFQKKNTPILLDHKKYEDIGATFLDYDLDGDQDLFVTSGGNEYNAGYENLQDRLYKNDGKGNFSSAQAALPELSESSGVVVSDDYDQDGDPDIFVGGRQVPGKYPYPATSYLLVNDDNKFSIAQPFENLGMVTDAVWSDADQDGWKDLLIVGEWMPLTIFQNNSGHLNNITNSMQTEEWTGWWYNITASDIDNDGDDDYLLGNLGKNYKYKASPEEPFQVFSDDFDNNGQNDIVLGYYNDGTLYPLRGRQCSSEQMPVIAKKFPDYHSFGQATLEQVYGEDNLTGALNYKANTFTSMVIENDNGNLIQHELPNLAQLSNINTSIIKDFDNDGNKDILIAGNLYPVEVETIRNDASIGLFLKGGAGSFDFQPVMAVKSGFSVLGDVKNMKAINIDGESYILIARNDDYLKLIKVNTKEEVVAMR
ncbi:MAG TPA: VCBS repeat-containing protein [Cyclobacteriaceae bacterium]